MGEIQGMSDELDKKLKVLGGIIREIERDERRARIWLIICIGLGAIATLAALFC